MEENKQGNAKPTIDKEYLKKLAEKIKAEKSRKEFLQKKENDSTPPPPPMASISPTLLDDEDEDEDMAAEKTAIIDLTALSGHTSDARLTIIDGKDEGKSIDITRDEIFAGRSLDNDFVISDISVSRKHFRVVRDGDHYNVSDMGSGNGIRVNGIKFPTTILYHNDVITAGARQVKFEILNAEMREKYSRKAEAAEVSTHGTTEKKKSSALAWVAILLIVSAVAVAGYIFMKQSEQIQNVAAVFKLGIEDIDKIDELIEKRDLKNAEKNAQFFLEKVPGNKQLTERLTLIEKEKLNQTKFEQAKAMMAQNKEEAEKTLKQIPEDSVFYEEVKLLVGVETISKWVVDEIKGFIASNKEDEALKKIYAALIENPENEEIKKLQAELTSKVGEQKAKDIQEKAEQEKKAAAIEKEKRLERKAKVAQQNYRPAPRPQPSPKPAPEKSMSGGSEKDLDRAIELYLSKDFDGAIQNLDRASGSNEKDVAQKAALLKLEITKFRKNWSSVLDETGQKKKTSIKKLLNYDKKISGGQLASEIESLDSGSSSSSRDSDSKSKSKGGSMGDSEAKELYMKARSMRNDDPAKAKEILNQIVDSTDSSSDYNRKAKKLLKDF